MKCNRRAAAITVVLAIMAMVLLGLSSGDLALAQDGEASPSGDQSQAEAAIDHADILYSGTWGTCDWSIDADGLLRVRPSTESSGVLDSAKTYDDVPWYSHREDIKKVVVDPGVAAKDSLAYLFYGCSKLTSVDISELDATAVKDMKSLFDGCSSIERLSIGPSFKADLAFPDEPQTWWSVNDEVMYSRAEITGPRVGIADTYLIEKPHPATTEAQESSTPEEHEEHASEGHEELESNGHEEPESDGHEEPEPATETTALTSQASRSIEDMYVRLDRELFLVSEVPARPTVTVFYEDEETYDTVSFQEGEDFRVSYEGGDALGEGKVVVKGIGTLTGQVELPFEVVEKIDITDVRSRINFYLPDGYGYIYRGKPITPKVTLLPGVESTYPNGVDFEVEYLGNSKAGKAYAVVHATGNFTGDERIEFTICKPASLDLDEGADIYLTDALFYQESASGDYLPTYLRRKGSSSPEPPCIVWAYGGEDSEGNPVMVRLAEEEDYELSYHYGETTATSDLGLAIATGINEVRGEAMTAFIMADSIDLSMLDEGTLCTQQSQYVYEGQPVEPKLAYNPSFIEGTDYTLSYSNNNAPGTCTITVKGKGQYTGRATIEVPIVEQLEGYQLSDCRVEVPSMEYTGSPIEPKVTVIDPRNGATVSLTSDSYVVTFENNVEVGTATVHIRALDPYDTPLPGKYYGYVSKDFEITPADISSAVVTIPDQAYTGSHIDPDVTVECNGRELTRDEDYLVACTDNVEIGTAGATIIGRGNYTGTVETSFDIVRGTYWGDDDYRIALLPDGTSKTAFLRAPLSSSLIASDSSCTYDMYVPKTSYAHFGLEVRCDNGSFLLVNIKDEQGISRFDDIYSIRSSPGNFTIPLVLLPAGMVHIEMDYLASGDYTGAIVSLSCMLTDAPVVSLDDATIEFTDPKPLYYTDVDGVDVPCFLRRDGEPVVRPRYKVTATDALGDTVVLDPETDYTDKWIIQSDHPLVGVGSLFVFGKGAYTGMADTVYGFHYNIDVAKLGLSEADLQQREYCYSGTPVEPKLRYRSDFVEGLDYTLSYRYNDRVGICVITVEGIGAFYGSTTIEVPVVAAPTHPLLDDCEVVLARTTASYTGQPIDPGVVVIDPSTGKSLVRDKDYILTFESNTNAGEATVHVSACMDGDDYTYDGRTSASFTITRAPMTQCEVSVVSPVRYTGYALEPAVTVVDTQTGRTLTKDVDYDLSYSKNKSVGTGNVTVTGKGNYSGTKKSSFRIVESGGWVRVKGSGRYPTMAAIVKKGFATSKWAVIATGDNFPDALVASSLAGYRNCPVILTSKTSLSPEAEQALESLKVKKVYIMGGNGAVSAGVEGAIEGMGIQVTRVKGAGRQATSLAAMQEINGYDTIVVATGGSFADALSIGPWCYAKTAPILLTDKGVLSDDQLAAIEKAKPSRVIIVGGAGAVPQDVEDAIADMGISVKRLKGANRYETSKAIARFETSSAEGMGYAYAAAATGKNFPDALAGAALCGHNNSVLVLADNGAADGGAALAYAKAHNSEVVEGYVLGGSGAVSDDLLDYLND